MQNANPALKGGRPGTLLPPRMSFPAASCGSCEAWRKQGLYSPAGRCLQAGCLTGTSPPQLPLELVCSSEHSLEQVRRVVMQKALQIIKRPQGKLLQGGRLPRTPQPGCGSSGSTTNHQRNSGDPQALCLYFFSPFFSPSEQRLRVGVKQRGEFP